MESREDPPKYGDANHHGAALRTTDQISDRALLRLFDDATPHNREVTIQAQGKSGDVDSAQDSSGESITGLSDTGRAGKQKTGDEECEDEQAGYSGISIFPRKLFVMLQDAENEGFTDIVSWDASGDAFRVHKKHEFEQVILPKYFKMTKYKSFTRQLLNYCFVWVSKGPRKGGYANAEFTKSSDVDKCHLLPRRRRPRKRRAGEKKAEPDGANKSSRTPHNNVEQEGEIAWSLESTGFEWRQAAGSLTPKVSSLEPRTIEEMVHDPRILLPSQKGEDESST